MKCLVFDTGPIITLTLNNLLWILKELKNKFKGNFYISETVKYELVYKPLKTKKFKFEALQVLENIETKVLEPIKNKEIDKLTTKLLYLANNSFIVNGNFLRIVHPAEMSGLAVTIYLNAKAFVVDERTTRLLIENPKQLTNTLQNKFHTKVNVTNNLNKFREITKGIRLLRSVELVTIAYELGLLDNYLVPIHNNKKILLEALLWGVKLHGCAVSTKEIKQIIKIETKK